MKNRQRTAFVPVPAISTYNAYWDRIPDVSATINLEQIESISWTTEGKPNSNECVHSTTNRFYPSLAAVQHCFTSYGISGAESAIDSWGWYVPNLRGRPITDLVEYDQFPYRREDAITVVLAAGEKPRIDIPLFIVELKDIRQFGRSLVDLRRYTQRMLDAGLSAAEMGSMSIKQVCDAKLAYSFGVRPLLSDTPKLVEVLNRAELVVRPLKKAGDTVRASVSLTPANLLREYEGSSFEYILDRTSNQYGVSVFNSINFVGGGQLFPYVKEQRQFRIPYHKYLCYGRLKTTPFGDAASRHQFNMMQNMGGLSTFYEATRFSFVLDYFADVGGLIKDLEDRMKAVSLQVEFAEGIWESHEYGTRTVVPSYTFTRPHRQLLFRDGWWHQWQDTLKYTWDGWKTVGGESLYKREPLSSVIPRLSINTSRRPLHNAMVVGNCLALLGSRVRS